MLTLYNIELYKFNFTYNSSQVQIFEIRNLQGVIKFYQYGQLSLVLINRIETICTRIPLHSLLNNHILHIVLIRILHYLNEIHK